MYFGASPIFFFGLHYLCYNAVSSDYLGRAKVTSNNVMGLWNAFKYLNYDDDFVFAKHIQPCWTPLINCIDVSHI